LRTLSDKICVRSVEVSSLSVGIASNDAAARTASDRHTVQVSFGRDY
jgi:hypothetical protein